MAPRTLRALPSGADAEACARTLRALRDQLASGAPLDDAQRELTALASDIHRMLSRRERRAIRNAQRREAQAHDAALLSRTGIRRRAAAFAMPASRSGADVDVDVDTDAVASTSPADDAAAALRAPRRCYVCRQAFQRLHHFYDSMCAPCAEANYAKRNQSADLTGRVALVTGARIKIGYHVALKLLRAGAFVVATTRFPRDAARRFAREPDFARWRDRLHVYGLDLRYLPGVERFADHVAATYRWLDVVIHNAAQTVRRPCAYYAALMPGEATPVAALPADVRPLLYPALLADAYAAPDALPGAGDLAAQLHAAGAPRTPCAPEDLACPPRDAASPVTAAAARRLHAAAEALATRAGPGVAAALSQHPVDPADMAYGADTFPPDARDAYGQPQDLRESNSWCLRLAQVDTPELIEVHAVNALAPFVLTRRLKPLLLRAPRPDRYVVHVSAVEGQFYSTSKTTQHPHTNMAKAALNMLTRTAAPEFAADGIYMNSVDTGWVTNEYPHAAARAMAAEGFRPPLDEVDGAARVCDPIFTGVATGTYEWGALLKNYGRAYW